jgi:hypothetical protein
MGSDFEHSLIHYLFDLVNARYRFVFRRSFSRHDNIHAHECIAKQEGIIGIEHYLGESSVALFMSRAYGLWTLLSSTTKGEHCYENYDSHRIAKQSPQHHQSNGERKIETQNITLQH